MAQDDKPSEALKKIRETKKVSEIPKSGRVPVYDALVRSTMRTELDNKGKTFGFSELKHNLEAIKTT